MNALIVQAIAWCRFCANYDRRLLDVVFLLAAARVGKKVDIGQRIMAPVTGLNATKQTGIKMKKLILLLAVLLPAVALAQEVVERDASGFAVIKDGNGELRWVFSPTPQMALEAIRTDEANTGKFAAAMIFKQKRETRSDAELDAFADELVRLVLETPSRKVADKAIYALGSYSRGLEVLIDIYENPQNTRVSLSDIFLIPNGGKDYVMNLFASLEPPKEPCKPRPQLGLDNGPPGPPEEELCPYKTEWCKVGKVLLFFEVVHHSLIYPTCDNTIEYTEDGRILWHSH